MFVQLYFRFVLMISVLFTFQIDRYARERKSLRSLPTLEDILSYFVPKGVLKLRCEPDVPLNDKVYNECSLIVVILLSTP